MHLELFTALVFAGSFAAGMLVVLWRAVR